MPSTSASARCSDATNVIINPHSGFQSDTSLELIYQISVENAVKCFEGKYKEAWVVRNGVGLDGKYIS